jgi:hypothetical protein
VLTLVTPPAEEPVSLAEGKLHLRVETDFTDDDPQISALITAARRKCEVEIWRAFVTSTWDYRLDAFPNRLNFPFGSAWDPRQRSLANRIEIPNPPLVSVTSIAYTDIAGTTQTIDPSAYEATPGTPGLIVPDWNTFWPYGRYEPGAVTIRYVAGYGAAADVPEPIKAAIKIMLTFLYENRGDADVPMPSAVNALLATEAHGAYR